jgi:purine-binding chemotaxis protein CheW
MTENKGRTLMDDDLVDDDDEDTQKDKFLTFRIGNEDYGIEIRHVTEIVGIQKITEVPDMMGFVKGVINLRGNVIPVIDVRIRFQMEPRSYDDRTCVVVVNIREMAVGLVVDTVNEVLSIPEAQVSGPPKFHRGEGARFIQGMGKVGDQVKILLDVERLLQDDELAHMGSLTGGATAAHS